MVIERVSVCLLGSGWPGYLSTVFVYHSSYVPYNLSLSQIHVFSFSSFLFFSLFFLPFSFLICSFLPLFLAFFPLLLIIHIYGVISDYTLNNKFFFTKYLFSTNSYSVTGYILNIPPSYIPAFLVVLILDISCVGCNSFISANKHTM